MYLPYKFWLLTEFLRIASRRVCVSWSLVLSWYWTNLWRSLRSQSASSITIWHWYRLASTNRISTSSTNRRYLSTICENMAESSNLGKYAQEWCKNVGSLCSKLIGWQDTIHGTLLPEASYHLRLWTLPHSSFVLIRCMNVKIVTLLVKENNHIIH